MSEMKVRIAKAIFDRLKAEEGAAYDNGAYVDGDLPNDIVLDGRFDLNDLVDPILAVIRERLKSLASMPPNRNEQSGFVLGEPQERLISQAMIDEALK